MSSGTGPDPVWPSRWDFGVTPLSQQLGLAASTRRLVESALALDTPAPEVDAAIAEIERAVRALRDGGPPSSGVRIGHHADDPSLRPYLDHAIHVGEYNPAFPTYRVGEIREDFASGTVTFPLVYEGPPGFVHGGFLAVFFDLVVGHHNSEMGLSGKTRSLAVRYLRPTPIGVELTFEVWRTVDARDVISEALIREGEEVLCSSTVSSLAGRRGTRPRVGARIGLRAPDTTDESSANA